MTLPRNARLVAAAAAGAAALLAAVFFPAGCNKPARTVTSDEKNKDEKTDPWEAVAKRLRKDTDPAAVKTALAQLTNDLASRTDVPPPQPLADADAKALAAVVPLAPQDLDALRPAGYSGVDPAYVADCLYLRDAARAIDPTGLPPADLARAAFAWVCRQVYLNPWRLDDGRVVPAIPPVYVLRRGSGTGLERAYVFLALLQQLGLDGCLIGPPDAADKPAGFAPNGPAGKPLPGAPRGPFWAVGVRVGADVFLFDPWRGEPLPGTLAQLKANPGLLKAWFEDKTTGLRAADVTAATVFLAVPVPALSPRMALLDEKLKADAGVRLAVNPAALRDRFLAAAPAGPGLPAAGVKFWNPPDDGLAYGRVLAAFLPAEEGGTDRAEPAHRLFNLYHFSFIPRTVFVLPPELKAPQAIDRLRIAGATNYEAAFFTPPSPRERMQRGQIQDATRYLADRQDAFVKGLERMRATDPGQIAKWCEAANEVYENLRRAQFPDPLQRQPQPDSDPAVQEARAAVEAFWRAQGQTAQVIIDRATARVGLAEATFQLALAKHEEAERQQLRADRATGADADRAKATAAAAWGEAANAWRTCLEQAGTLRDFPGRLDHARALADRATKQAPPPK
jgi:ribonuclease D